MSARGSIPRVAIEGDVVLALEAPGDEKTSLGGHDIQLPPYVEIALVGPAAPGLADALEAWDLETWGPGGVA